MSTVFWKLLRSCVAKLQSRFGQLDVDELRSHAEGETALIVRDLRPGHGRQVLGRLQAVLPFLAAFEQIADAQIELRCVVDVVGAELVGLKDRQELRIADKDRIRTQIRRDFFRLTLLDRGARSQQVVVVPQRHLNGIVERNGHRARFLCEGLRLWRWRLV